ncbi:hypothetical protein A8713_08250 [Streptomyces sp. SAT1]|nr:hypothetical protein A8713_08250 [Streptomyces sp. SAT1]
MGRSRARGLARAAGGAMRSPWTASGPLRALRIRGSATVAKGAPADPEQGATHGGGGRAERAGDGAHEPAQVS